MVYGLQVCCFTVHCCPVTPPILQPWFMVCKSDASRCVAILSPFQSCCRQEFVKLMHEGGTTLAYGPKQKTHGWQPIDRGHIGATLKAMMRQEQQLWLEDPATLSPSQSCCHGLRFASLMLHSALLFGHPPNLAVMFMVCNSDAFTVH